MGITVDVKVRNVVLYPRTVVSRAHAMLEIHLSSCALTNIGSKAEVELKQQQLEGVEDANSSQTCELKKKVVKKGLGKKVL